MAWFLESERLRFRRYERRDLDFVATLFADPDVMQFIGTGVSFDRGAAAARLERWIEGEPERGFFLALTKADGAPVGHAALVVQTIDGVAEPEIGWWLARRFWGNGYATEAAAAFRDYAFNVAELPRVVHVIAPENARSIAVAQRIGSYYERSTTFHERRVAIYAQTRNSRGRFGVETGETIA